MKKVKIDQPEEHWLILNLEYPVNNIQESCFEIANKLLAAFEVKSGDISEFNLESFHYFFEGNFIIRIEVNSKAQVKHAIELSKTIVDSSIFNRNVEYITDYKGEWQYRDIGMKGYGAAWLAAKKFFDASCRFQLHKRYSEPVFDESNYYKLIHCFLNQQGFGLMDEMGANLNLIFRRLATNLSDDQRHIMLKNFVEKVRNFPNDLEEIFSLIQQDKFDEAKKKMGIKQKDT